MLIVASVLAILAIGFAMFDYQARNSPVCGRPPIHARSRSQQLFRAAYPKPHRNEAREQCITIVGLAALSPLTNRHRRRAPLRMPRWSPSAAIRRGPRTLSRLQRMVLRMTTGKKRVSPDRTRLVTVPLQAPRLWMCNRSPDRVLGNARSTMPPSRPTGAAWHVSDKTARIWTLRTTPTDPQWHGLVESPFSHPIAPAADASRDKTRASGCPHRARLLSQGTQLPLRSAIFSTDGTRVRLLQTTRRCGSGMQPLVRWSRSLKAWSYIELVAFSSEGTRVAHPRRYGSRLGCRHGSGDFSAQGQGWSGLLPSLPTARAL